MLVGDDSGFVHLLLFALSINLATVIRGAEVHEAKPAINQLSAASLAQNKPCLTIHNHSERKINS